MLSDVVCDKTSQPEAQEQNAYDDDECEDQDASQEALSPGIHSTGQSRLDSGSAKGHQGRYKVFENVDLKVSSVDGTETRDNIVHQRNSISDRLPSSRSDLGRASHSVASNAAGRRDLIVDRKKQKSLSEFLSATGSRRRGEGSDDGCAMDLEGREILRDGDRPRSKKRRKEATSDSDIEENTTEEGLHVDFDRTTFKAKQNGLLTPNGDRVDMRDSEDDDEHANEAEFSVGFESLEEEKDLVFDDGHLPEQKEPGQFCVLVLFFILLK
jgi:hypothetical protein